MLRMLGRKRGDGLGKPLANPPTCSAMTGAYDMIGSITRLDDEDDKDKNPADGRNAPT